MDTRPPEDQALPRGLADEEAVAIVVTPQAERQDRLEGSWTALRGAELLGRARGWAAVDDDVALDCSGLERVDVATLQILLALSRALAGEGHALTLVDVPPAIENVIRLGGLAPELLAC